MCNKDTNAYLSEILPREKFKIVCTATLLLCTLKMFILNLFLQRNYFLFSDLVGARMAITISLVILQLGVLLGLTNATPHSTPYSLQVRNSFINWKFTFEVNFI